MVTDKAYIAFSWLFFLTNRGVSFVTRMKKGSRYKVVKRNKTNRHLGVTSDQPIWLTGPNGPITPQPCAGSATAIRRPASTTSF